MRQKKLVEKTVQHIETVHYNYEMFLKSVQKLSDRLRTKTFDGIYAIPRGGYVFGLFLAHELKLPIVNEPTKDTLIVDDICDTGNTMLEYPDHKKVVLVTKVLGAINIKNLIFDIVYKDDQWVKFFWEKE